MECYACMIICQLAGFLAFAGCCHFGQVPFRQIHLCHRFYYWMDCVSVILNVLVRGMRVLVAIRLLNRQAFRSRSCNNDIPIRGNTCLLHDHDHSGEWQFCHSMRKDCLEAALDVASSACVAAYPLLLYTADTCLNSIAFPFLKRSS